MEISNIRIEKRSGKAFLIADLKCGFSDGKELWFSVDAIYADWLNTQTYDPFLIESVYLGMYHNEDITIKGKVNKQVYHNLVNYVIPLIKSISPAFHTVKINVDGFIDCPQSADANIVGTGYSGGVDSFCTIYDHFETEKDFEYKINTLFFFNVGQYPGKDLQERRKKALQYFDNSKLFAEEVGLNCIFVDSNMFDYYLPAWEYDAGPMCRISCILLFEKVLTRYYLAGSFHYLQQNSFGHKSLSIVADEFIYNILTPHNIDLIIDGNQYFRSEKVERIAGYEPATRHLNVCVNPNINVLEDKNCSVCHKCLRTLIVLESLGELDRFGRIFHLDKYKKVRREYISRTALEYGHGSYATENVDFARAHGIKFPSKFGAWLYLLPIRLRGKMKRIFKR